MAGSLAAAVGSPAGAAGTAEVVVAKTAAPAGTVQNSAMEADRLAAAAAAAAAVDLQS